MLGIGLKVASVLIFLLMGTLLKASGDIPTGELAFYRSFFALVPIIGYVVVRGEFIETLKTKRPMAHVKRGLASVVAMGMGFYALAALPLPESTAISYATPLLIVVLSALVLKEVVRIYRWSAVLIGLVGVGIMVAPRLTVFTSGFDLQSTLALGTLAAIGAAIVNAIISIEIRDMTRTERSTTIVFYFSVSCAAFALLTLPFGWKWPNLEQTVFLVLAGFAGGIAQILMTECFRHADMSVVAPFEYISLVFSILIGFWVFGDVPTWQMLVGSVIVVAAGIFIVLRERALGLEKARLSANAPSST